MSNTIFDLLQHSLEWKEGGLALSFLGITMVLTLFSQLPSTWAQWRTVQNEKAEIAGIHTPFMIALAGYFVIFFIYGVWIYSIGSVFNCVVLGPIIWITTRKLNKRRPFTQRERQLISVVAAMVLVAVAVPPLSYTVASIALMVFPLMQIYTICIKGTSEGVESAMYKSYSFVCLVWTVYGFLLRDYFIMSVAGIFIFLYGGIVVACWKYRPAPKFAI